MEAVMEHIARTPKQLGTVIRRQRRALKLNQARLGEKTRLRQATISAVETGEPGTEIRTIFDTLAALDLELVVRPRSHASADDLEDIY
jgi:HTH-type transcriptional regulator/antitoxin HipB